MLWSPIKAIAQQFNSKLKFQQSFMPDFTGTKLPTRPQLWLLSDVHKDNGWKFPVIFDKAQFVKTHKACPQTPWHCSVMLSGTTLDNNPWINPVLVWTQLSKKSFVYPFLTANIRMERLDL